MSLRQLDGYLTEGRGARGVRQVRRALGLASEESMSPNETRFRLIWVVDAGLPMPLVNQPVFGLDGALLGIADLLDPVAGLGGEYDGADHRSARRHSDDVGRESRFRDAGLEVVRATGPDIPRRALVTDRIPAARRRAMREPARPVRWTLEPPGDWSVELPLHDRLELRELWSRGA